MLQSLTIWVTIHCTSFLVMYSTKFHLTNFVWCNIAHSFKNRKPSSCKAIMLNIDCFIGIFITICARIFRVKHKSIWYTYINTGILFLSTNRLGKSILLIENYIVLVHILLWFLNVNQIIVVDRNQLLFETNFLNRIMSATALEITGCTSQKQI